MARRYSELRSKMAPASRARAEAQAQQMLEELPLHELRQALDLTQDELAAILKVNQAAVSKLERRTDMYISTLSRFVEAMGGSLELHARFPGGDVKITSLQGVREAPERPLVARRRRPR